MKIKIVAIYILLSAANSLAGQEPGTPCYEEIKSSDFMLAMQRQDVLIIDVRLNKDYRRERIENAFLASSHEALEGLLANTDTTTTILVYCDEGKRSKVAAEFICSGFNFKKVYSLQGGIKAWKNKYSVDSKQIKKSEY